MKYSVEMAATRPVCLREWLIRQTNFPFTLGTLVTLKKNPRESTGWGSKYGLCQCVVF